MLEPIDGYDTWLDPELEKTEVCEYCHKLLEDCEYGVRGSCVRCTSCFRRENDDECDCYLYGCSCVLCLEARGRQVTEAKAEEINEEGERCDDKEKMEPRTKG